MSRSHTSLTRLWQIRRIIRHHGLLDLLEQASLPKGAGILARVFIGSKTNTDIERGIRIRQALEELGPVFVKLGQALSTRPDLLPADIASELTKLQDEVPAFASDKAMGIIKQAYGNEFDEIFESVEQEPLASASVAQVHAARLKEGNALQGKNDKKSHDVIIKVLRPGMKAVIRRDLDVMYLLAGLLQKYWSRGAQFKPLQVIKDYDNTINGELDLRQEAANCSQMAANFEGNDIVYVPVVYWDYTQVEVMVMERIYGTSVRDIEKLKHLGYDLKQLAADGVETFFKQAFEDNFFHADMHPGNIFVSDQGKWIAIDFGIMGVLTDNDKQYLAEMLLGFFNRDYRAIAQSHLRAGWIPQDTQLAEFEAAIRMVCEPNFAKPISEISFGVVLLQLFQTIQRFEMPVQPQLILLYKTLLNIEGLGRQLYPELNLWDTAKPFLENWMKQQLSPQALLQDLKRDWPRWRAVLTDLPDYLQALTNQPQSKSNPAMVKQPAPSNRLSIFHQVLGFGTALCGLVIYIGGQNAIIDHSLLTELSPLYGTAGIVWAYFKSR